MDSKGGWNLSLQWPQIERRLVDGDFPVESTITNPWFEAFVHRANPPLAQDRAGEGPGHMVDPEAHQSPLHPVTSVLESPDSRKSRWANRSNAAGDIATSVSSSSSFHLSSTSASTWSISLETSDFAPFFDDLLPFLLLVATNSVCSGAIWSLANTPANWADRSKEKWQPLKHIAVAAGGDSPKIADRLIGKGLDDTAEHESRDEAQELLAERQRWIEQHITRSQDQGLDYGIEL